MALLNYSKTYAEVLEELNISNLSELSASNSGDYVKLFFTGDGNIITHGVNYLPLFNTTTTGKGMVPANTSGDIKKILRASGVWEALTTSDLPMWSTGNYTNDTLLTSLQISLLIAANDALVFKGSLGEGGTVTTLPTTHKVGWTYRVITGDTYAGKKCEAGDLITCIVDGTSANNAHWTVILTNINGAITSNINGVNYLLYSNAANGFSVYAPTTGGTEGQILVSYGNNAPTWQSLALGTGLSQNTQNGTRTISLVNATTSSIGGVKIGNNITVNSGSISITKENIIAALGYTPGDASASLVPATADNIGGIKVGSVGTSASNASITIGSKNYAVHIDSNNLGYVSLPNFVTSSGVTSVTITLGTGITVSNSGTAITSSGSRTISLNTATTSTIGGIKIAKNNADYTVVTNTSSISANVTSAGKYYGIEIDSTGKAFVYVPWSNTTYTAMTAAEATTGTATTARSITAKVLHDKILSMLPDIMVGATADEAGTSGLVPAPAKGDQTKFLRADGTWVVPTNTTYSTLTAADATTGTATTGRLISAKVLHDKIISMLPSVVSSSANGLAPKVVKETSTITNAFYVLASSNGSNTPSWYKLPANAFADTNTWREILVGGTSIGSNKLNFMPTGDVYVKIGDLETSTSGVYDISFGISWYNISDKKYETA